MAKLVIDCSTGEAESAPLTEAEQVQAERDRAAADEQRRESERTASVSSSLRTVVGDAIAALESTTRTKAVWDALSPAQRQEATRVGLLAVAKLARLVLQRLDSP